MRKIITLLITGLLTIAVVQVVMPQSTTHDTEPGVTVNNLVINPVEKPPFTGKYFTGEKSGMLYNNGPLVNIPGAAGFPDTSRLQGSLSMTTLGHGCQLTSTVSNRIADDVTITDSTWLIDSIIFFLYQTNSTTTSPITGCNLIVWEGAPGVASSYILWGDSTTNRLSNTYWGHIYRDSELSPGATDRPVMRCVLTTIDLNLPPGIFWLDLQAQGSASYSGPWAPPITINGQSTTGNGMQRTSTGWGALQDGGSFTQQGIPFIIYGQKANTQGIVENAKQNNVKVYPNPAVNYVNIRSSEIMRKITVYNQFGQLVISQACNSEQAKISVNKLDFGIYSISIQTDTSVITKKLIIK